MATDSLIKSCRAKISGLRRMKGFHDWRKVRELAEKMRGIIDLVDDVAVDPKLGLALTCAFLETDLNVLGCCDDSNGTIGTLYRYDAAALFHNFACECEDKDFLARLLLKLFEEDGYSLRLPVLDNAGDYFSVEELRDLCGKFQSLLEQNLDDRYNHYRYVLQAIAKALKDPEIYVEAELAGQSEPPQPFQAFNFAEEYLRAGFPHVALKWIKQATVMPDWKVADKQLLEIEIYRELGETNRACHVARELFFRTYSADHFELLGSSRGMKNGKSF